MTEKRKVRTTMRPGQELEVTEAEYLDLQRQGLLVEDVPKTTPEGSPTGAEPGEHRDTPEQIEAVRNPRKAREGN